MGVCEEMNIRMCNWVTVLYTLGYHNIVNQLYFNKIIFFLTTRYHLTLVRMTIINKSTNRTSFVAQHLRIHLPDFPGGPVDKSPSAMNTNLIPGLGMPRIN